MDVELFVGRIVETYETASLYSDRGTLVQHLAAGVSLKADFETSFERPHRFAFSVEMTATGPGPVEWKHAYRLACEGDHVQRGDPEWRRGRPESLDSAVATLTGVSCGTAHVIPKLLMPDRISGRRLFGEPERAFVADESIDGELHHVVEVRQADRVDRVYVAAATLIIRAIEFDWPPPNEVGSAGTRRVTRADYRAVLVR